MSADGLARFIAERLDEHERGARAAPTQHWRLDPEWSGAVETEWENWHTWLAAGEDTAPHIARHDPAHVLAFVAAGRAILEQHRPVVQAGYRDMTVGDAVCASCGDQGVDVTTVYAPCPTVRAFGGDLGRASGVAGGVGNVSTNYYWRTNVCTCCGRYDVTHIGKSGSGFEGHFDETGAPAITSWQDWKRALRSGGEVWDEYDVQVPVEEFIGDMEARSVESRRRQYDWVSNPRNWFTPEAGRYLDRVERGCDWLDQDGFSFHGGAFE